VKKYLHATAADPTILKKKAKDNLSAPSSFIANAHNKIIAFYTEKSGFGEKYEPIGGGSRSHRPP